MERKGKEGQGNAMKVRKKENDKQIERLTLRQTERLIHAKRDRQRDYEGATGGGGEQDGREVMGGVVWRR